MSARQISGHATVLIAAIGAVFGVSDLYAQDDELKIEEIIVTAQRREQSILDVPISTSVYNAEQIENSNWRGARDFIYLTPNVSFTENDSQGTKNGDISIRGISDLTSGGNERIIQTRAAVGYYVDDFSVGGVASGAANPPLNDVERVEVLRGPQGTYFGRNATGGAINVVSKKPHDETEGKVSLGVGNFGTYHVGLLGNMPLQDNLFLRLGVAWDESDGYIDNLSPTGNDPDYENLNARAAIRWLPGDWTIDLTLQTIREQEGNLGRMHFRGLPGTPPVFFPLGSGVPSDLDLAPSAATCGLGNGLFFDEGNDDKICENADTYTNIDNDLIMLRADYAADRFTVTSITGQIKSGFGQFEDLDNTGYDIFNRLNEYDSESFSQELRLTSAGDNTLNWIVGGFYYDDKFQVNNRIITGRNAAPAFTGFLTIPGDFPNENNQFVVRRGWAVFADVEWSINDQFALSLGGRYSDDTDKQIWTNTYASFDCAPRAVTGGVPAPLAQGCELRTDQTLPLPQWDDGSGALYVTGGRFAQDRFASSSNNDSTFTPRVALNWRPNDDHSVFLTWSQGYRPAGTRVAPDGLSRDAVLGLVQFPDNRSVFNREEVTNIELGWKGYFNDRRLRIEASVFDLTWDDMQVRVSRTLCRLPDGRFVDASSPEAVAAGGACAGPFPSNKVENADEASSQGAELIVQSLIGENFTLGAAIGVMDAKFESFANSSSGDLSGSDLPNAPELTWSLSGQYDWEIGDKNAYVKLEAAYRDGVATRLGDVNETEFPLRTDDFTIANLHAGVSWDNQTLSLSVANLFEEDYITGLESFAPSAVSLTHPRHVFVRWTAGFD